MMRSDGSPTEPATCCTTAAWSPEMTLRLTPSEVRLVDGLGRILLWADRQRRRSRSASGRPHRRSQRSFWLGGNRPDGDGEEAEAVAVHTALQGVPAFAAMSRRADGPVHQFRPPRSGRGWLPARLLRSGMFAVRGRPAPTGNGARNRTALPRAEPSRRCHPGWPRGSRRPADF